MINPPTSSFSTTERIEQYKVWLQDFMSPDSIDFDNLQNNDCGYGYQNNSHP